jgi:hypothetical protein
MYNKINNDENISSLQGNESYDCETATFRIAKGNIQSVLSLFSFNSKKMAKYSA